MCENLDVIQLEHNDMCQSRTPLHCTICNMMTLHYLKHSDLR